MMDEDVPEGELLLFLSLRRCRRRQKPKKTCKKSRIWVRDSSRKREQHREYCRLVKAVKTR